MCSFGPVGFFRALDLFFVFLGIIKRDSRNLVALINEILQKGGAVHAPG